MKQIHILSVLLWLLYTLPIAAQKEYDFSKYFGTWVYENQDTVFTVQFGETTIIYTNADQDKLIAGNYKLEVKGKMVYNHFKPIPNVIDEKGKQSQPYPFYGIYFRAYQEIKEHETNGKLLGIIDPIKNYNNGNRINCLWIKLLPDGRLKWTLMDYSQVRRSFPEAYENPDEPFTGYSMPTHAIFRRVK